MLAAKVNKKKNAINLLVLGGILLIIFVIIYQNFIAGNSVAKTPAAVIGSLDTKIPPVAKIKKDEIKLEALDEGKFSNLVEFEYEPHALEALKVGKEDPFYVEELLNVANKKQR